MARREFDARPGPGSVRRAVVALPALVLGAWAFGIVAILAHSQAIVPRPTFGVAAAAALRGIVGLSLGIRLVDLAGGWIPDVLPLLGVAIVTAGFAPAFRPAVGGLRRDPGEAGRAPARGRGSGSRTLASLAPRGGQN